MNKYASIMLLAMFLSFNNLIAQTYAVTGAQEYDTLNVRAKPHYKAIKIGELSHDATGIIINEYDRNWCRVEYRNMEGYRGHGPFTYVLAEGLKGKADMDKDGYVKTLEIANYIDEKVPEIAEREFNRAQYPVVSPSGQAFPIGKVK